MTTINDVASLAGVSASTVSRALSGKIHVDGETKDRVMKAIKQLNYRPNILAKGLKEGKTNTIGLMVPNIRNPIFPAVARGIEDVARKYGYTVILCNTDENLEVELDYVNKLKNRWVDGFIFATATRQSSHIAQLQQEGYPLILLVRRMEEIMVDAVVVNNFKASYEAVSLLIERGCRKVAMINGSPEINVYRERLEGYLEAHKHHDIGVEQEIIMDGISGTREGYEACKTILKSGIPIDAVFAASERKAIGAIKALRDFHRRIPEDVKLIGVDDDLETTDMIDPPLTTVAQPTYKMGTRAMERLIRIMISKKKHKPHVDELDARLIIRSNT